MKETKLYNVLFPFWMLLMLPWLWGVVIFGNFLIDSLILLVCMLSLKMAAKKQFYKKHILKVYFFGLLADIIGAVYMIVLMVFFNVGSMGDELYLTLPALAISAVMIFIFDYFISFKSSEKKTRFVCSLVFAIATSPYTFLVPSSWLY